MTRSSAILAAVALAGLLAACHKPQPQAQAAASGQPAAGPSVLGQSAAGQAGAPGGAQPVTAAALPHPRPGEWEVSAVGLGQAQGFRNTVCAIDRPINLDKVRAACQSVVYRRTLTGGLVVDAQCAKGSVSYNLHMVTQGDFNTAYSTDMEMGFILAPGAPPHVTRTHMTYRYLGPCPAQEQAAVERAQTGE